MTMTQQATSYSGPPPDVHHRVQATYDEYGRDLTVDRRRQPDHHDRYTPATGAEPTR